MANQIHLAVDIGASSGRVLAGEFDGSKLRLSELHRFDNGPVYVQGGMYWDLLALWKSVQEGLRAAGNKFGAESIRSVGVDTWGVDFGLLGPNDEMLCHPRCYRDPRKHGMMEQAFDVVPRADIFAATGLQFMEINSLYQLITIQRQDPWIIDSAETFMMMGDIFHWLLTGEKTIEFSNATTTQMLNPQTCQWATDIMSAFQIPEGLFREVTLPGTDIGPLQTSVAEATNLGEVRVILPGTHDTASAVLAVPAQSEPSNSPDWCYISSGTWSLMGVEVPDPVINETCERLNFTNEGGVGGTVRVLKNIGGLWLVQECRRIFGLQGRDYTWDQLTQMAAEAEPLTCLVNPDAPELEAPRDMPQAIRDFCAKTNQPVPESDGAVIRCALESLALRYRQVHGWLQELTGSNISTIHIVGGGSQNAQLNQMAADACNCNVVAGPVEATAIGNAILQAISVGSIGSIAEARSVIANSFPVTSYEPKAVQPWDKAFETFVQFT